MNFYQFNVQTMSGEEISLEEYRGKVVLVVNTASKCGLTPQFKELEALYEQYKDRGLVILGFPCNQFAGQDPGTNEEINSFCALNYGVSFPMFQKIDVNGEGAHPLYKYLKQEAKGLLSNEIKWNFTKFLIDSTGKNIKRYAPVVAPSKLRKDIEDLLKEVK